MPNGCRLYRVLTRYFILNVFLWPNTSSLKIPDLDTDHSFPGWKGEADRWRWETEHLSWHPRAFLLKNFLSKSECEHLIRMAKPTMAESLVTDNSTGASHPSSDRTSTGTFLDFHIDEVVAAIERRVAKVTMIPEENQEALQILRYVNGQKYEPHYDFFSDEFNKKPEYGGQRLVTVLMYLSTPEEGGETVFPKVSPEKKVRGEEWSECAQEGLAVKAVQGNAILFWALTPNGEDDNFSLHGSCPTTKGEKWSATKWIHVLPSSVFLPLDAGDERDPQAISCRDRGEVNDCSKWMADGECQDNPTFMWRACRKTCGMCS